MRSKTKRPPGGGLWALSHCYILSAGFLHLADLDLDIFFLLILLFDMSPLAVLSL